MAQRRAKKVEQLEQRLQRNLERLQAWCAKHPGQRPVKQNFQKREGGEFLQEELESHDCARILYELARQRDAGVLSPGLAARFSAVELRSGRGCWPGSDELELLTNKGWRAGDALAKLAAMKRPEVRALWSELGLAHKAHGTQISSAVMKERIGSLFGVSAADLKALRRVASLRPYHATLEKYGLAGLHRRSRGARKADASARELDAASQALVRVRRQVQQGRWSEAECAAVQRELPQFWACVEDCRLAGASARTESRLLRLQELPGEQTESDSGGESDLPASQKCEELGAAAVRAKVVSELPEELWAPLALEDDERCAAVRERILDVAARAVGRALANFDRVSGAVFVEVFSDRRGPRRH